MSGPPSAQPSPVEAIGALESDLARLDDESLKRCAAALRGRARAGEPLDDLLVEAFAVVREASRRVLGQRPHDVQLAGGVGLHHGRVVEMQTGEGKTLAAVAPVFLNALDGRGAHVLTFNDYLARRDARWMGPVYRFLDLEVGFVQSTMDSEQRRSAYACDVVYLTAREAGFDLLRDSLCLEPCQRVQRPFHIAVVDEADSILIDEARIPLVIAGSSPDERVDLPGLAGLVRSLERGTDFDTDEYAHNIFLTESGAERVERSLGCASLFAPDRTGVLAAVRNALHAEYLLRRDVDYIVRRGSVELVDEFTGRVAEKRHWPDGLQAAVEAKEGLRPGSDGRILGSITLQHFLRLYPRLCGMSATVAGAREELRELYGLEVEVIPTHRPCIREDLADLIYTNREARDRAVVRETLTAQRAGRPVLVGTASVADSERLARRLRDRGVACQVLNAKNDGLEAAIVARAGAPGAVTISTNMAGRGTDIRLGGPAERERERVVELGGLYVIGTHRHESARIDRQLRGRAGRQGDPGSSRFFVTLDDHLLVRYGIEGLMPRRLLEEGGDRPIESRVVRREVDRAQRIIDGQCFDLRRRLYAYSEIIEYQRRRIADWRRAVLEDTQPCELLRYRAADRYERLLSDVGPEALREAERTLTLLVIDRCWGEYLREMQLFRDEAHLVALVGKEPLAEFFRTAIGAFERLIERIDTVIVETFRELPITRQGVDWERAGLRGPSATWTYLVHDDVFGGNVLRTMAHRPGVAVWGVLVLGPVLFLWGLVEHWRRRRRQSDAKGG